MIWEIHLFEFDLGQNIRHFVKQIEGVTVGFAEVNPQTMD